MYNSNPEDYSTYRENNGNAQEIDYAHPEYYHAPSEQPGSFSAQPVPRRDPYAGSPPNPYADNYANYQQQQTYNPYTEQPSYQPHYGETAQEYRGPQSLEHYAAQQQEQAGATQGNSRKKGAAGLGGLLIALGGLLLKFGWLLKFGLFGFSALASVFVYSLLFGWSFAIGLVAMLFIHEMGHALVMRLKGIPMGGMIFVPLFGAAVTMRQMPQNAKDEAEVGIAGPIAGALAASVCLFLAQQHPGTIWGPLAYFGFFLNLFNLIPIVPFDGGRVLAAIDRRIWIIGFILLLAYQIWQWLNGNFYPWLMLFVVMAAMQLWSRGLGVQNAQSKAYYDVPLSSRILMGLLYFGLVAVLFLGMTISHGLIPGIR
ncbi:site-2 protease family protein [Dictyobacter formicarum]|uniref:Peptidase M50 domain-containing protein n=1 Tax=Dictyobacter formicarum TaxID=2778368 RepID=A0ABQ3VW13_9CHLR|nr:site-2 protease family protein [Dictyobacter formicarum]GHO89869.1 hypothetical protein KSZ_78750 [Dictyobacter formicarum]